MVGAWSTLLYPGLLPRLVASGLLRARATAQRGACPGRSGGLLSSYAPPTLDLPVSGTRAEFNLDGQLAAVSMPDGDNVTLAFDDAGRLAVATLPAGQLTYSYDPVTGQVAATSSPSGVDLEYSYDGFNLRKITWSGVVAGTVDQRHNDDLQIATRSVNGGHTVSHSYDGDGLLSRAGELSIDRRPDVGLVTGTTLGLVTTALSYNEFGELSGIAASVDQSPLLGFAYQRDRRGRITLQSESRAGQVLDFEYRYDDGGRLAEVLQDGARTAAYTYDANGNRTSETDALNDTTLAVYDDQDRLLSYGEVSYSYTANGELETRTEGGQTIAYSYDAFGSLLSVLLPDGLLIEYVHDARGRRVGKKVNGALVRGLVYKDPLNPIAELDGEGNVVSRFVYGTRSTVPEYMVKAGVTYRFVVDHLGSPRWIVDAATGAVVQELRYDAFGNLLLDTNPGFQPFGFAGGLYDHQTGWVRFGLRDYDPQVGRWTTKDPAGFASGDTNLYGYVGGDPVNLIDPSGLAIDIVVDIGFIGYDIYNLVDNLLGPCANETLGGDLLALGADIAGALIPFATGLGAAVRHGDDVARAVNPNTLHHIFGRARHNLDDVVEAAGSREAAFEALQQGAQSAVDAGKLTGQFETVVNVGEFDVTVRGAVLDGIARIGTAFR